MTTENLAPSMAMVYEMKQRMNNARNAAKLLKRKARVFDLHLRDHSRDLINNTDLVVAVLREAFIELAAAKYANGNFAALVEECVENEAEIKVTSAVDRILASATVYEIQLNVGPKVWPLAGLATGGHQLLEAKKLFIKALQILVHQATLKNIISSLYAARVSTMRKAMVIEHLTVPKIQSTIAYLLEQLDDREREEMFRLKKVTNKMMAKNKIKQNKITEEEKEILPIEYECLCGKIKPIAVVDNSNEGSSENISEMLETEMCCQCGDLNSVNNTCKCMLCNIGKPVVRMLCQDVTSVSSDETSTESSINLINSLEKEIKSEDQEANIDLCDTCNKKNPKGAKPKIRKYCQEVNTEICDTCHKKLPKDGKSKTGQFCQETDKNDICDTCHKKISNDAKTKIRKSCQENKENVDVKRDFELKDAPIIADENENITEIISESFQEDDSFVIDDEIQTPSQKPEVISEVVHTSCRKGIPNIVETKFRESCQKTKENFNITSDSCQKGAQKILETKIRQSCKETKENNKIRESCQKDVPTVVQTKIRKCCQDTETNTFDVSDYYQNDVPDNIKLAIKSCHQTDKNTDEVCNSCESKASKSIESNILAYSAIEKRGNSSSTQKEEPKSPESTVIESRYQPLCQLPNVVCDMCQKKRRQITRTVQERCNEAQCSSKK